jgi:protein phosphatase
MGYCFTREALLLLLADGMGGHQNGEIAAALSLQTMGALFKERATPDISDPSSLLDELIYAAHQSLLRYRAMHRLAETLRTTIVACVVQHGRA